MAKLVWRVKLVAERQPGVATETELARIERPEQAALAELGLTLAEAKRLTAALQAEVVPAQMAALSVCPRACEACGRRLAARGYYGATFRSLFGEVPVRVRRWFVCPCQGTREAKSVAALDFGGDGVAPELAYLTARYAAMAPFGRAAALLSELLPLGGAQHASTVRNRMLRVGTQVVQAHAAETVNQPAAPASDPVVVGLDGGYVRGRHRAKGRRFEVIAGKVIRADGAQHRFAFARTGPTASAEAFRQALAAAGVEANTPATVLCDGDAGLWRLQREVLPSATPVLDWVARRGALRARAAGGPRPRRRHGRHAPRGRGGSWPGARKVAPLARALARVPAQARRPVPLDGAQTPSWRGRHRPPAAACCRAAGLPRAQ
ncbi:MAG: hypothetical protein JOY66_13855 [Acetobacteraceae bacterium]|nr:hypothetical protein [Acetobacteraceae bacterium]